MLQWTWNLITFNKSLCELFNTVWMWAYIPAINVSPWLLLYLKSNSQILSKVFLDLLIPRWMFKCGVTHSQNIQRALRGLWAGPGLLRINGYGLHSQSSQNRGRLNKWFQTGELSNQSSEEGLVTSSYKNEHLKSCPDDEFLLKSW